ncbi:cytochrome b/b6 domain-containing protein [Comamonas humi]
MTTSYRVRVWDLPTRLFHWALVLCFLGSFISGQIGGNAMVWHFRSGYTIAALLLFRFVWGLVGGYWSRFGQFALGPGKVLAYMRGRGENLHDVGHSPMGAWAVVAMLLLLGLQVASGLMSDDEIAFAGPLTRFVSGEVVGQATSYHKAIGQYLLLGMIALHLLAIVFYIIRLRKTVLRPMFHGHKELAQHVEHSTDTAVTRLLALLVLGACAGFVWWVSSLG